MLFYQLQLSHGGTVTQSSCEFGDAGIPAFALCIPFGDIVEYFPNDGFIIDESQCPAARAQITLFTKRNHLLRHIADLFCFRLCSNDLFVVHQAQNKITVHGRTMRRRPIKLSARNVMTHISSPRLESISKSD